MPLPVAHGLIGASVVAATRKEISWRESWRPLLIGAAIAIAPDFDIFFVWALKLNVQVHGGITHSILFSIVLGLLGAWLAREFNPTGIVVYTAAVLSHAVLDVLTKKEYGGAMLLWPLSSRMFRLEWFNYLNFFIAPALQTHEQ